MNKTDWIQTYTKKKFYPLEPETELICIEDIAHSLALQCRFVGHSKFFYSVAQHSVVLARLWFDDQFALARYALLHDASEAYLSDLPHPLKYLPEFDFYRAAEDRLQRMIYERFGLAGEEPPEIKSADREICGEEAMSPTIMFPLHPDWQDAPPRCSISFTSWLPEVAEERFLLTFNELFE